MFLHSCRSALIRWPCVLKLTTSLSTSWRRVSNSSVCIRSTSRTCPINLRYDFTEFYRLNLFSVSSISSRVFSPAQYKADTLKSVQNLSDEHPMIDYTPPSLITLLFTDLGVLTPSAVSDELIKLYL